MTGRLGLSMVEMLVVGIIVLVTGLTLPAIMRTRQASRDVKCFDNLREFGRMLHAYADLNNDYIPIGTSTVPHREPPNELP